MSRPRVCYNCTERSQTCHSTCEKYAGEVAAREKEKEAARKKQILPIKKLTNVRKYQSRFNNFI